MPRRLWADTRYLEKSVEDTNPPSNVSCREGGPGSSFPGKVLKLISRKWDFRHSEAKSAFYKISSFNLGSSTEHPRACSL